MSTRRKKAGLEARQPSGLGSALDGGRTWWAHFEFTRINIGPTILRKKIEGFFNVTVFSLLVDEIELRRSPVGLPRSLDVAADLAESPEFLMPRIEQQGSRRGIDHQIAGTHFSSHTT
jgi:hypothetical protein